MLPQTSVPPAFESPGAPLGVTPVQDWYILVEKPATLVVARVEDLVVKEMP